MTLSDIMLGWVDDNTGISYIQDRHTNNVRSVPIFDSSQDLTLIQGSQIGNITTIEFQRDLYLCNITEDRSIEPGTIRIIYAYNENDPSIENVDNTLLFHGYNQMGSKSVNLMNGDFYEVNIENEYTNSVEFTMENVKLTGRNTDYFCRLFEFPTLEDTAHVVRIEPMIEAGHEGCYIHYSHLFVCVQTHIYPCEHTQHLYKHIHTHTHTTQKIIFFLFSFYSAVCVFCLLVFGSFFLLFCFAILRKNRPFFLFVCVVFLFSRIAYKTSLKLEAPFCLLYIAFWVCLCVCVCVCVCYMYVCTSCFCVCCVPFRRLKTI